METHDSRTGVKGHIDPKTGQFVADWGSSPSTTIKPTVTRAKVTDAAGRVIQQAGNFTAAELARGAGRMRVAAAKPVKAKPKAKPKKKPKAKPKKEEKKKTAVRTSYAMQRAAGLGKKFL